MARYLVHLDNPEKVQYLPEDVIEINGADWKKIALTDEERPEVMELLELIEEWEVHGLSLIHIYSASVSAPALNTSTIHAS